MSMHLQIILSIAAAVALVGCSESGQSGDSEPEPPAPGASEPAGKLSQQLRVAAAGEAFGGPVADAVAAPGDRVLLGTVLPGPAAAPPQLVRLRIDRKAGDELEVVAKAGGETATATLRTAGEEPITLRALRWSCGFPPAPTFCPVRSASATDSHFEFAFSARPETPVAIAGTVMGAEGGPEDELPPEADETEEAEPLEVVVGVAARSPGATEPADYVPEASVSDGDLVTFRTVVEGGQADRTETVSLALERGPGKSLVLRAEVPGGIGEEVVLNGADGESVSLVNPRFTCTAPPQLSPCPALDVGSGPDSYTASFKLHPPATIGIAAKIAGS